MNDLDQKISLILLRKGGQSSSDIYQELLKSGSILSLVTIKRALTKMKSAGWVIITGTGRSTVYTPSATGRLLSNIDSAIYCQEEPDKRSGFDQYNFDLLPAITFDPFSDLEKKELDTATAAYHLRTKDLSTTLHQKELERFVIELSWKSSKIEGNTYTLLDTEKLLREGVEAHGHSKEEARMILNHKAAFSFIYEHREQFQKLTRSNLETVHQLIVKDLNVNYDVRTKPVGIVGSRYRPLDNQHQLLEAIERLTQASNSMSNGYARALIALLGTSYLRPFEDGNKRTARLIANAILLAHQLAPLSYRNVEEKNYREALFVFYELNSLVAFKQIFISQYDFAARNYLVV